VLRLWNYLLELLLSRRVRLELSMAVQKIFQEMIYVVDWMEELKSRMLSDDFGKHLMGVEDLLQKHQLVEADISIVGERVKTVSAQADRFLDPDGPDGSGSRFSQVPFYRFPRTNPFCQATAPWSRLSSSSALSC